MRAPSELRAGMGIAAALAAAACGAADEQSLLSVDSNLSPETTEAEVGQGVDFYVHLDGDFSPADVTASAAFSATRSDSAVLGPLELIGRTPASIEFPANTGSGANDLFDLDVPQIASAADPISFHFKATCLAAGTSTVSSSLKWNLTRGTTNGEQEDFFEDVTFTCTDGGGGGGGGGGMVTAGDYSTIGAPEGAVYFDPALFTAKSYEVDPHVAIAGGEGYELHMLSDGMAVESSMGSYYGCVVANESMGCFGSGGAFLQDFDSKTGKFAEFGQLISFMSNITGAAVVANPLGGALRILLADNTTDQVLQLTPIDTEFGPSFEQAAQPLLNFSDHLSAIPGNVVDVFSPAGDGPFLGISDNPGNPGRLFWVDPDNLGGIVDVGAVGEGPRRIVCLEPAGTPCAVSSFNAGEVRIVDWADRSAAPTIRDTPVAVDGPIGCDMATVGGVPTALCTGFNDDSLHFISIDGVTVTDDSSTLTNCDGPGHAIFVEDTHTLVTCNLSDNFQVTALP